MRVDDTEIPGINRTVGYISLTDQNVEEVVRIAMNKLGKVGGASTDDLITDWEE